MLKVLTIFVLSHKIELLATVIIAFIGLLIARVMNLLEKIYGISNYREIRVAIEGLLHHIGIRNDKVITVLSVSIALSLAYATVSLTISTITQLQHFFSDNPACSNEIEFERAKGSFAKLQAYVDLCRSSGSDLYNRASILADVRAADKDETAWTAAQQADTIAAYETYLNAFPSGAHAEDAKRRVADLRAAEAKAIAAAKDETAWAAAQQADTIAHAEDAKRRVADLRAAEAKAIAAAKDKAAWAAAQQADTSYCIC